MKKECYNSLILLEFYQLIAIFRYHCKMVGKIKLCPPYQATQGNHKGLPLRQYSFGEFRKYS
ncbi:MAG: hypothetical protein KAI83_17385 [Thiomargarita sp.]|nr:hypothetical protein [Thiomargarita sp.]